MSRFLPALTSTTAFGVGLVILAIVTELLHRMLPEIPLMDAIVGGLMAKAVYLIVQPQKASDPP